MTIRYHADDSTLMSYAAGALPEALSAVVATHVRMCARCRKELATLEMLGGAVLAKLPHADSPVSTANPTNDVALAMEPVSPRPGGNAPRSDAAAVLSRLTDDGLTTVPWRRLAPGVWHYPLRLSPGSKGDLRLFKVAPGQTMPVHGHGGTELTLMLHGSYTDENGRFDLGDLADLDQEHEHAPSADPKTGCICLIASEQKARYKGLLARLLQPFIGI